MTSTTPTPVRVMEHTSHRHDADELTWVASGSSTLVIDGRRWQVDTRFALVIPAGVEHTIEPRPDSLVFPIYFPGGTGATAPTLLSRSATLEACARVLLQPGLSTLEACQEARLEVGRQVAAARELPAGALPTLPLDERARHVATSLLRTPAAPFGLEEWAKRVHTSDKTLQRSFRRDTGMTFPQWRTAARLSLACTRLERGESIAVVARAVGFSSASSFISAFRRCYGITPGRYRRAEH